LSQQVIEAKELFRLDRLIDELTTSPDGNHDHDQGVRSTAIAINCGRSTSATEGYR
jgi:hypothetical protein